MKLKVREMLDSVDEEDLYRLQYDLANGGSFLKKLIESKIHEREASKSAFCVTCGEDLARKSVSYTLLFGPEDFKKKACFCEIDCLEYFMGNLKKMENPINQIIEKRGD